MFSTATTVDAVDAGEAQRITVAYERRKSLVPARRYSHFDQANLSILHSRERAALMLLRRFGLESLAEQTILEVGCGTGGWLPDFIQWGADPENLYGIDLLPDRIETARRRCPAGVHLECRSAVETPFPSDSFDIVLQSTVFTSILAEDVKQRLAAEMLRILKPNGMIVWYDFRMNNPRNRDVRGVGAAEIRRLFPGCQVTLHRITLAPPLARCLAPLTVTGCQLLEKLPFLCTHYLGGIRKPA